MTRGRYNGQGGRYNDQGVGTMTRGRNNGRNLNFYKSTGEVGIMSMGVGIMVRG